MPHQPLRVRDLTASEIHRNIEMLIHNLVNIEDETGRFLLKLPDGRTIDTKSWNDWEWTHAIGLYGLYQYYTLTGSPSVLSIMALGEFLRVFIWYGSLSVKECAI